MNHIARILIATLTLSSFAIGAKSAALAPTLAKPGASIVDESFSASALGKI